MSRKIVGVTVGTPLGISAIKEKLNPVTSVNGVEPDENGNVEITVPDSGGNVDVTFEGETMIISTANNAVKIDGETLIL